MMVSVLLNCVQRVTTVPKGRLFVLYVTQGINVKLAPRILLLNNLLALSVDTVTPLIYLGLFKCVFYYIVKLFFSVDYAHQAHMESYRQGVVSSMLAHRVKLVNFANIHKSAKIISFSVKAIIALQRELRMILV